jgi:surface protein
MNSNKSVVGVFVKRDYPLNITIEGEGTVEERIVTNPSGREYPHGTTVELTPAPKEGWVFDSWGGDLTGTESPKTIKVDKEKNVTVKFRQPIFRLGDNGMTCICENVKVGEKGFINGIEYEAVDNDLIRERRDDGKDLTKLCTSLVTDMQGLFASHPEFNLPIGNWDVGNIVNMSRMFAGPDALFNQPIGNWDVGNVKNMSFMFSGSTNFNQPIGNWDVSNVTDMSNMFGSTNNFPSEFNQPIGNWDVSKVINMNSMFSRAIYFNQPLNNWDVSNVTDMSGMFFGNTNFNQSLSNWDVRNVTSMYQMFSSSAFNQPLENWNVSKVIDMRWMFRDSPFNQPLGIWDVSKVNLMTGMFEYSPFNQNISKWCVTNIKYEPQNFSSNSPLTSENKPKWGTCPN